MSFVIFPGFSNCGTSITCNIATIPRSQRSALFQHTVMAIEAIFALGQQFLPRTNESIYFAAVELNPSETVDITTMNEALANARKSGLMCINECGYYSVDVQRAQHKRSLKPYVAFINLYNPCRVTYPPLTLTPPQ